MALPRLKIQTVLHHRAAARGELPEATVRQRTVIARAKGALAEYGASVCMTAFGQLREYDHITALPFTPLRPESG
ncbi:hypothetical protein [Amycolatopsis sp. cmx-11-51]|uniref:hypothetical protein n=1 Tax=unclassified Amycolatopsis TaxID=2618356 RepID=UPI0039E62521